MINIADDDELDLQDEELNESDGYIKDNFKLRTYPADFTLEVYKIKLLKTAIFVPDFQRKYVWSEKQASRLIESFLLNIPVPNVFLLRRELNTKPIGSLEIIDGQQRLLTVLRFMATKEELTQLNPNLTPLKLKEVSSRWNGKTYADLSDSELLRIQDTVLRATIIEPTTDDDYSSVYEIFDRLNTGGSKLNPMEIRKCLFYGQFFLLLEQMNTNMSWRKLLGLEKEDRRMRDIELVLRVIALSENVRNYSKPMSGFLTKHLSEIAQLDMRSYSQRAGQLEETFLDTALFLQSTLPDKAFFPHRRLNYAVLDCVFATAMSKKRKESNEFRSAFMQLLSLKEFQNATEHSTSDERELAKRFSLAQEYLLKD